VTSASLHCHDVQQSLRSLVGPLRSLVGPLRSLAGPLRSLVGPLRTQSLKCLLNVILGVLASR
jgi:hypothetical protein